MAATKRSQNKCKDCRYTWYPRGKDLSRECPNCKSTNVTFAGPGLGSILLGLVIVGAAAVFFGGNKKSEEAPIPAPTPAPVEQLSSPIAIEPTHSNLPAPINTPAPVVAPQVDNRIQEAAGKQTTTAEPLADNERIVTQEELDKMKARAVEQAKAQLSACATNDGSAEARESCIKAACAQVEDGKIEQCGKND